MHHVHAVRVDALGDLDPDRAGLGALGVGHHRVAAVAQAEVLGNDPLLERELMQLPLTSVGSYVLETYGSGCSSPSGLTPAMDVSGTPKLGNTLTVGLVDGPPSKPAPLVFSAALSPTSLGSCTLLIDSPLFVLPTLTANSGAANLPIPLSPTLLGTEACSQWIFPAAGALTTSNALELVPGQ